MARLSAAQRRALPSSAFAGPNRSYPIQDKGHAIAARGEAGAHASPAVEARVREAVGKRFPGLVGKGKKRHRRMHR